MSVRKKVIAITAFALTCVLLTPVCGSLFVVRSMTGGVGGSGTGVPHPSAPAALVKSVYADERGGSVRVFINTDGAAMFNHFTLTGPSRIVVDILNARSPLGSKTIPVRGPVIERVRVGQPGPNVIRVVLDCKKLVPYNVARDGDSLIITTEETSGPPSSIIRRSLASASAQPLSMAQPVGHFKATSGGDDDDKDKDNKDKGNKDKENKDKSGKDDASKKSDNPDDTDDEQKKRGMIQGKIIPKGATIIVEDRTLTGPFSSLQLRGSRLFLPVVAIARALGDDINVSPLARTVDVRRQTGVDAQFNAQLNQVREAGSVILAISNTADIVFPPNSEELMLPVEIVASLLDVSVFVDESARAVRITRGQAQSSAVKAGAQHASWEFYQIDYAYNLNLYSSSFFQHFTVNSNGRIGDGRFTFMTNFDGGSSREPVQYRRGNFTYDSPDGRRVMVGDFGTGNDLIFMSTALRGAFIRQPLSNMRLQAFAGRVASGILPALTDPLTGLPVEPVRQYRQPYDTDVFGSYATFGPSALKPTNPDFLLFSAGGIYFNGPHSSGEMATGSVKYTTPRNQFQADAGLGNFSGFTLDGRRVQGVAPVIDASEVFKPTENFSLQGRIAHIGSNYLTPQAGGSLMPMNLMSGGFSWRPGQWIATSLTAASINRLDEINQKQRQVTGTISVTPRSPLPTLIFSHTQGYNTPGGSNSYTFINATKEFRNLRLFGNFNRIRTARAQIAPDIINPLQNPPNSTLSAGAMIKIKDTHTLQFNQAFGSAGSLSGDFDWFTSSLLTRRISFGAGLGYARSETQFFISGRVVAGVELPRRQMLQFSYARTQTGPQILLQVRGPLLVNRRAEAALNAPLEEIRSYGAFYGRVYQDINLNGRFDVGVDRPQPDVKIQVDGSFFAVSDRNGEFRVENVKVGEHLIYMDLLSVRADLTLLDSHQQTVFLNKGRDSIIDFRLVRTGRIKGMVWLDANGNGRFDEGEQPLIDVRIVTASGRDTLTDERGQFVIGDLPPGNHVILIDEKTLPDKTRSASGSIETLVVAGGETDEVKFPVVSKPIPVQVRRFPSDG